MHDLGILGKLLDLACDSVIKSGSYGEEQVTFADGVVGRIAAVHSHIAHIEFMAGGNGALTHNSSDNRDSCGLHKGQGSLVGPCRCLHRRP